MYGAEFGVNGSHHQAIKEIGNGFDVAATADNTTIEGIIHKELLIFGVQWHPERMCFANRREDTVNGAKIFEFFINLRKEF